MKKVIIRIPQLVLAATLAYGCGSKDSSTETKVQSTQLSYEYSERINGIECTTHRQSFASQQDRCLGLLNDELNHGCARGLRDLEYTHSCGPKPLIQDQVSQKPDVIEKKEIPVAVTPPIPTQPNLPTQPGLPHSKNGNAIAGSVITPFALKLMSQKSIFISVLTGEINLDEKNLEKMNRLDLTDLNDRVLVIPGQEKNTCLKDLASLLILINEGSSITITLITDEDTTTDKELPCMVAAKAMKDNGFTLTGFVKVKNFIETLYEKLTLTVTTVNSQNPEKF